MAFRMKHWIGLVVVGMAFAALGGLPPSSPYQRESSVTSSAAVRHSRLYSDFNSTAESLRRLRWSDSLSALTLASAEGNVNVAATRAITAVTVASFLIAASSLCLARVDTPPM